jgi:hypothetical protein
VFTTLQVVAEAVALRLVRVDLAEQVTVVLIAQELQQQRILVQVAVEHMTNPARVKLAAMADLV